MTFEVLLSPPDVDELEQEYVLAAMKSGWVAPAGPDLDAFEQEVAARLGVEHAVGLASGTAGLHLALVSWGVGPGDVVPVSTLTFAATVNAIRYVGAEPFFIDSEPQTGNLDPELLREGLDQLQAQGRRVPVAIVVDLLGCCADYTSIAPMLQERGIRLLSDAAESLGSSHAGRPAGAWGDAAVVSFNGNKIMTTSGGGMLLTNDASLAAHVRKLSTQAREPVAHYEHTEVGYNYRLSNILAALGRAQLHRLDDMIQRRRQWRAQYREFFESVAGTSILESETSDEDDNCWLTAVIFDPDQAPRPVSDLGTAMTEAGIETRPVWKPMHLQPVFDKFDGVINGTSQRLFEHGLTLPSGSALTNEQFARVLRCLSAEAAAL